MDRYYKSNGLYVEEITIKQIRADAIEPIKEIITESEKMMWGAGKALEKIKEKLKEQTNE